jgi:hypothetical protein
MRKLAFSWGYKGWGTHTREFVRTVDALERRRGMRPPIFADVRFSRSVRATGFRGAAFEKTVGKSRYRWLQKLGNRRIGSGQGGIRIADRSGGGDLLRLISDAAKERRRVIFFCWCERPCECHRAVVARLLVKSARKQGKVLTIIEWPGGEPETVEINVTAKVVKDVLRGANRAPLGELSPRGIRRFTALPWGSRVRLRSDAGEVAVVAGPAQLAAGWYLPLIGPDFSEPTDTVEGLRREAERKRKSLGYGAVTSARVLGQAS